MSSDDVKDTINKEVKDINDFYARNKDEAEDMKIKAVSSKNEKGVEMNGIEVSMKFKNLDQMLSSQIFAYVNEMFPISSSSSGNPAIVLTRTDSMFGTHYKATGKLSILGKFGQQAAGGMSDQVKSAKAKFTFSVPTPFVTSNATEKSNFGKSLTWVVTSAANTDLSFNVFVPNLALLIAALIIILLLVIIFILWGKIKKIEPDVVSSQDDEDDDLFLNPENELEFVDAEVNEDDNDNEAFSVENETNSENSDTEDNTDDTDDAVDNADDDSLK